MNGNELSIEHMLDELLVRRRLQLRMDAIDASYVSVTNDAGRVVGSGKDWDGAWRAALAHAYPEVIAE